MRVEGKAGGDGKSGGCLQSDIAGQRLKGVGRDDSIYQSRRGNEGEKAILTGNDDGTRIAACRIDHQIGGVDQDAASQAFGRRDINRADKPIAGVSGHLDKATIAAGLAAARGDAAGHVGKTGAKNGNVAAGAGLGGVGRDLRTRRNDRLSRHGCAATGPSLGASHRGADRNRAAAGRAGRIDACLGPDACSTGRGYLDGAALGAGGAALCRQRPGDADAATGRVDRDLAGTPAGRSVGHGVGGNFAPSQHEVGDDAFSRLRRQQHGAAVGDDGSGIGDQRRDGFAVRAGRRRGDLFGDVDGHQPIAVKIDNGGLGAGQNNAAELGLDDAGIDHLRRHQGGKPGLGHGDAAFIDHGGACFRRLVQNQAPGLEVGVGDADGRHHQGRCVHLRTIGEQHTGLVDQHLLVVGVDTPGDHRRVGADHAVDGQRVRRRCGEVYRPGAADIEAAPVNAGVVGALRHVQRGAALRDGGTAGDDGAARWQRGGR